MKVTKAVIPAAGLGTRFLPATKAQPKEMLPIVDKPSIQYIVEEAVASGIKDILIISGRNKQSIENHFDKSFELEALLEEKGKKKLLEEVQSISNMVNIHYVRQKEPKGLGHAILCAKTFIGNEPFGVLLGDDIVVNDKPCLKQLIDVYDEYGYSVMGVQNVPDEDVSKYGIVGCEDNDVEIKKVVNLVEKPNIVDAPSNFALMGRYIITSDIFEILENTKPGANDEIQLTDALRDLVRIQDMYAYEFIGKRYDVGNKLGFLRATVEFALSRDDLKNEFHEYLKDIVK